MGERAVTIKKPSPLSIGDQRNQRTTRRGIIGPPTTFSFELSSFGTTSLPVPLNTTSPSCGLSHDSNLARLRHLSFRTHVGLSQASPTTRTQMSVPSTLYRARVSSIGSDTLIRLIEEQAGASEQNLAGPWKGRGKNSWVSLRQLVMRCHECRGTRISESSVIETRIS